MAHFVTSLVRVAEMRRDEWEVGLAVEKRKGGEGGHRPQYRVAGVSHSSI